MGESTRRQLERKLEEIAHDPTLLFEMKAYHLSCARVGKGAHSSSDLGKVRKGVKGKKVGDYGGGRGGQRLWRAKVGKWRVWATLDETTKMVAVVRINGKDEDAEWFLVLQSLKAKQ